MDSDYRFGRLQVSCEGYDYPEDPYILRGSCGVSVCNLLVLSTYLVQQDTLLLHKKAEMALYYSVVPSIKYPILKGLWRTWLEALMICPLRV